MKGTFCETLCHFRLLANLYASIFHPEGLFYSTSHALHRQVPDKIQRPIVETLEVLLVVQPERCHRWIEG